MVYRTGPNQKVPWLNKLKYFALQNKYNILPEDQGDETEVAFIISEHTHKKVLSLLFPEYPKLLNSTVFSLKLI
jgi:hypothetical protein